MEKFVESGVRKILRVVVVTAILVLYIRGTIYKLAFVVLGEYIKRKVGEEVKSLTDAEIKEIFTHVIKHEWKRLVF